MSQRDRKTKKTNAAASILPCDAISRRAALAWCDRRGQGQSGTRMFGGVCTDSTNNHPELLSFARFHKQIAVIAR
ncbi:hypothetical protein PCO31010_04142 [Pandoraea commovens]|uniref:Uncharacterized protein n=1 Tax=Pandoraea commovens TaxID=2508289 RepID=A0A5E4XW47_9BURK|nr:hypothetical protein PCO31010_04142 [Pandoraea commovens]